MNARHSTDTLASFGAASGSPIPYPHARTLRRTWLWQGVPPAMHRPDLARVAHHEAGHVVRLEWIGLTANATPSSGICVMPALPASCPDPVKDVPGELAATAASIYQAGTMTKLIHLGIQWTGPVFYPAQPDHQRAEAMLLQRFSSHSSAGYGFAQPVVLHVLAGRLRRVRQIANALILRGVWE